MPRRKLILNIVAFAAFACCLYGRQLSGQYLFNTITEEKGLISNQVQCITQDSEGFLWLGTRNGLCRFDGKEILTFRHNPMDTNTVCDNEIKALYHRSDEEIWVGTRRGISVFNPKEMKFSSYSHDPLNTHSLSKDIVQFFTADPEGNILVVTDANGFDLFDITTGIFSNHLPSDQIGLQPSRFVNALIGFEHDRFDSAVIWFGTQLGVLRYDFITGNWRHILLEKEKASEPQLFSARENIVRDLLMDEDGKLWLATWGGGLCHLDPKDQTFDIYKFEPMHPVNGLRNNIAKLHRKSRHEMYILAEHGGVAVFNTLTKSFNFLSHPETGEMLAVNPSGIVTDENGFLALSSFTNGLFFTNLHAHIFNKTSIPHNLVAVATHPGFPDMVFSSSIDVLGNLLIVNTSTGELTTIGYTPYRNISENHFPAIISGKERIWLVENANLYWWDSHSRKIRVYDSFDPTMSTVEWSSEYPFFLSGCETEEGEIWLGTKFDGIFRINPVMKTAHRFYDPDEAYGNILFQNFISCLYHDSKGRIWYGTDGFGYFDPENQKFVNLTFIDDFPDSPLKSALIKVITETGNGHIWLGTINNGIMVIDPETPRSYVASYSTHNGLAGSLIKDMITDRNGDVWAITENGLSRIFTASGKIENYGSEYGLTSLNKITGSASGEIFICSPGGIYSFFPDSISPMKKEIKPYIKSFKIFDKSLSVGDISSGGKAIHLKAEENFFSIEYGAINFFNPAHTDFCYMLEGMDNQWIMAGDRKHVSYTNLPGGNYTFRLRTSDGINIFNEIAFPITIDTPFRKTIGFYFLVATVLAAILFGFYRYRMQHIRKQEKIRSEYDKMIGQLEMKALRAQMNPHFLFNSLNSIRYYILKEDMENASEYITKFSKLLRLILRNSRQNLITLEQELETLHIYIEFEQMRFGKSFEFVKTVSPGLKPSEIMIQPMTIQPFIENAIWHGLMPKENNRLLSLSISATNRLLTIVVEDNGIGRVKAKAMKRETDLSEAKSYGLQITGERFEMLQKFKGKRADFVITDLYDSRNQPSGTRVTIFYEF